jgi:hypothetical protein
MSSLWIVKIKSWRQDFYCRLYWRFYRNPVAADDHRLLQGCDRISNTISTNVHFDVFDVRDCHGRCTWRLLIRYSQTQTNMIGILGDVGIYCGFTFGLLYDHFGPKICSLVSAVLIAIGYGLSGIFIREDVAPFWLLVILYIIVGQVLSSLDNSITKEGILWSWNRCFRF